MSIVRTTLFYPATRVAPITPKRALIPARCFALTRETLGFATTMLPRRVDIRGAANDRCFAEGRRK